MTGADVEKGALLYQVSRTRRWGLKAGLALAAVFFVIATVILLLVFSIREIYWETGVAGVLVFTLILTVPVLCYVLAGMILVGSAMSMPFRVYEGGVTTPLVPLRRGLAGREVFIPAAMVTKVTWEGVHVRRVGEVERFRFHRLDGGAFDVRVDDGDEERVAGLMRQVLSCEVEGPGEGAR